MGVHYFDAGKRTHFQKARAVILSANGAQTARLLLARHVSFVTSGRGQPTMTIQALAFRAAEHIGQFAQRNEI